MAKSKTKIIHRLFFPFCIYTCIFLFSASCRYSISPIQANDFKTLKKAIHFLNINNSKEYIQYARGHITELSYMEAFLAGIELQKTGSYNESVFFFYMSAFYKRGNRHLLRIYQNHRESKIRILPLVFRQLKNLSKNQMASPLLAEAIYEIGYSSYRLNLNQEVLELFQVAEKQFKTSSPIKEKIEFLKARILQKKGNQHAEKIFRDLYKKTEKLIYLYYFAISEKNPHDARKAYQKILTDYPYRWLRSQAANRLENMAKISKEELTSYEKLAIWDLKNQSALLNHSGIDYEKLDDKSRYLYLKILLKNLSVKNLKSISIWLEKWKDSKLNQKEKTDLFVLLMEKIYASSQYPLVIQFIDQFSMENHRLKYLYILSLYHGDYSFEKVVYKSAQYLKEYSENQIIARIYSDQCAFYYFENKFEQSKECFKKLDLDKNDFYSSRKAYYLALMEKNGNSCEKTGTSFREIFQNYPDQYYGILALEKSTSCGLKRPPIYIDSIWEDLEKDLESILEEISDEEKIGLFFVIIGDPSRGMDYLKNLSMEKRLLAYLNVSLKTGHTFLAAQSFKKLKKYHQWKINPFGINKFGANILFPRPYLSHVKKETVKYGMNFNMIYAIMRQESSFLEKARSSSNAQGLLQLLPSTARLVNKKEKIPSLHLYNPIHNIRLGVRFFSNMLDLFSGDFRKAAGGYNGGPNYIRRLEKKQSYSSLFEFYEKIPKFETFFYVQYTWYNYQVYQLLYELKE